MNQNFNNVWNAMLTLFEISTTEGWVDVMYSATDATEPMKQPQRDIQEGWSLFFVAFILVGAFFILNLCVGVIIDNFNEEKEESGKGILVTESQQKWIDYQKHFLGYNIFFPITHLQSLPPTRRRVVDFVMSKKFDYFIMICIILNTVVMGMKVYPEPSENYNSTLLIVNYAFSCVYFIEASLKLYAFRTRYFYDRWNLFDFGCVCCTILSIIVNTAVEDDDAAIGPVVSVIRIFRIARIFRMVRFMKGLSQIFNAFLFSLPKLFNVAAILILLLFLYSVLGVHLFAKIRFYGAHDEHGNFRDFYRAFMTLVRSMTGEAWNEIMHGIGKDRKFFRGIVGVRCVDELVLDSSNWEAVRNEPDFPYECGKPLWAHFYYLTFTMIVTFVCLNLVIAVVLEGFEDAGKGDEREIVMLCTTRWQAYDPEYKMMIPLKDAVQFIFDISNEVIEENSKAKASDVKGNDETKGGMDKEVSSFKQMPIKLSSFALCKVPVTRDLQVHFIHVVQGALRLIASKNDPALIKEIQEQENRIDASHHAWVTRRNSRHLRLHTKDLSLFMSEEDGEEVGGDLHAHVAAAKIQDIVRRWKTHPRQKDKEKEKQTTGEDEKTLAESSPAFMVKNAEAYEPFDGNGFPCVPYPKCDKETEQITKGVGAAVQIPKLPDGNCNGEEANANGHDGSSTRQDDDIQISTQQVAVSVGINHS